MLERYSERARRVIFMARYAAGERGATAIDVEDLLKALVQEDSGHYPEAFRQAARTFAPHEPFFSLRAFALLLNALEAAPPSEPVPMTNDMPLSLETKKALTRAYEIAGGENGTVQPLHLLSALMSQPENQYAQLLNDAGITLQQVTDALGSA